MENNKPELSHYNEKSPFYLSPDYGNEYHPIGTVFRFLGIDAVRDYLKKSGRFSDATYEDFHMQTYEERAKVYGYPLTGENKKNRDRINELADQMNKLTADPDSMDEASFRKVYDEFDKIIYGDKGSNL